MEGSFKQYLLLCDVTSANRLLTDSEGAALVIGGHQALLSGEPSTLCLPRVREEQSGRCRLTLLMHYKSSGCFSELHLHCELEF